MKRSLAKWKDEDNHVLKQNILCYYVLFLNDAEHFAKREWGILIFQR